MCVFIRCISRSLGVYQFSSRTGGIIKTQRGTRTFPFAFISGSFEGSMLNWATIERKAFAKGETCKRMEDLLLRQKGFHISIDHRKLLFILDLRSVDNAIARYRDDKIPRRSMVLQMFRYTVEHVAGSKYVWNDLLPRWSRSTYHTERVLGRCDALSVVSNVSPQEQTNFVWPSLE